MGIFIIVLAICIIASIICYKLSDSYCNFTGFLSWVFSFCAGIVLFVIIVNTGGLIFKDQWVESQNINAKVLEKLLKEDYNPENLKNALEFNASQKKSVVYNTSFMMLCVESCYAVDTIPIPATKFLPNTKNTIDVNVTNK
jgi:hypothetical protein